MYAHLKSGKSGGLTIQEFCNLYDAVTLVWEPQYSHIPWFHSAWMPLQNICQLAHKFITWKYFDTMMCKCVAIFIFKFLLIRVNKYAIVSDVIILCNGFAMVVRAITPYPTLEEAAYAFCASWDSILFLTSK
jgi:hypothetical protein